jgi:ketosteroid isomerase-like protein
MTHPKFDIINRFFEAYGSQDESGIHQVLVENVKWTFPGQNPMSGTKAGIDEVIAFFDTMGGIMGRSNVKAEKLVTGANDDYVVECQHIWTSRDDGNNLDHHWCVLWKFENGKITEGRHFAANQFAVDEFFNKLISADNRID